MDAFYLYCSALDIAIRNRMILDLLIARCQVYCWCTVCSL